MWSNEELTEIVGRVKYNRPGRDNWYVRLSWKHSEPLDDLEAALGVVRTGKEIVVAVPYVQVVGETAGERWTGRKWMLSRHMTVTEVVSTCFKAIMAAEEHELREFFTYKDHAVFGPHYDVEAMISLSEGHKVDVRTDAMTGA